MSATNDFAQLKWRKSSFSGGDGCVEVAPYHHGQIAVRDSKNPDGAWQCYSAQSWSHFVSIVKRGK